MVQPARIRIHAEDYYDLPEYEQHDLIQLIDGEVVPGKPSVPKHQAVVGSILYLLVTISRSKGGEALCAPVEVFLDEHNIFEPDVLYLRADSRCTVGEKRLTGAPDLVVEVLSPGTAKYDRQQKYEAYQRRGVSEYWIVDPLHETVEVWTLGEGMFKRQGAYAGADTFDSATLGEAVTVKAIFSE